MSREKAVELVRGGKRFLLTCHLRPDGDAVGSMLGLGAILRAVGKEVVFFSRDPIPDALQFLMATETLERSIGDGARFDATFVMDTAARDLLPGDFPPPQVTGPVVIVDHHVVHDDFGDVIVREPDACATGEVVLRIMADLGIAEVPADAAAPLYTSIVTDTGGFRYPRTTPETLRMGASLLEAGVDPWQVAYHVFEGWPRARLRLLGAVLETLDTNLDGRLAMVHVTRKTMHELGANDEMVEGLVNYARRLRGVEIAVLLWEQDPDSPDNGGARATTRLSLRSTGHIDVARIAAQFGGGGHRAAAGARVLMDLESTRARVIDEARRALDAAESQPKKDE